MNGCYRWSEGISARRFGGFGGDVPFRADFIFELRVFI